VFSDFVPDGYHESELDRHDVVEGAFALEEVARIRALGAGLELKSGAIGGGDKVDQEIRKSRIGWIPLDDSSLWLFERIGQLVADSNRRLWRFDLGGLAEQLQYSRYEAPAGGYDWHLDIASSSSMPKGARRKISVVVQLSDPDECFGGELELRPARHVVAPFLDVGSAALFPSYLLHRVAPVKQGMRESLVTWVSGPPFR
jgi:PKHD-type hydroxylase